MYSSGIFLFAVCSCKRILVTIYFCIQLCCCWLALKRPIAAVFLSVTERKCHVVSTQRHVALYIEAPIGLFSACAFFSTSPAELTVVFYCNVRLSTSMEE